MKKITVSIAMGGSPDDVTTTTEPPSFLKPYLSEAAFAATNEFNSGQRNLPPDQSTIAPMTDTQKLSQQMLLNYATGGVNTPQQPNYTSPVFSNMGMTVAAPTNVNANASVSPSLLPKQGMGPGIVNGTSNPFSLNNILLPGSTPATGPVAGQPLLPGANAPVNAVSGTTIPTTPMYHAGNPDGTLPQFPVNPNTGAINNGFDLGSMQFQFGR